MVVAHHLHCDEVGMQGQRESGVSGVFFSTECLGPVASQSELVGTMNAQPPNSFIQCLAAQVLSGGRCPKYFFMFSLATADLEPAISL